jgi:hypothetical protein
LGACVFNPGLHLPVTSCVAGIKTVLTLNHNKQIPNPKQYPMPNAKISNKKQMFWSLGFEIVICLEFVACDFICRSGLPLPVMFISYLHPVAERCVLGAYTFL